MVLQESGEMYLESILVLIRQGKAVRSIDIVDYMGYSKPSVSRAVGLLKAGQYIDVDNGGYITLTAAGRAGRYGHSRPGYRRGEHQQVLRHGHLGGTGDDLPGDLRR